MEEHNHDNDQEKQPEIAHTQPGLPPEMLPPPRSSLSLTQASDPVIPPERAVPARQTQQMRPAAPPRQSGPPTPPSQPRYASPPPGYGPPPAPPPRRRRKRRRRRIRVFSGGCLLTVGAALFVFIGLALIVGLVLVNSLSNRLEDGLARLDDLANRRTFQTTTIYDRYGADLYQIFEEGRRTNVSLSDLPPYVAQATIAIEDDSFYENPGVDIPSAIRAVFQNVQEGGVYSGFSTITMQLVRNIAFDYEYRTEVSLQRKIEEVILAIILTNRLSKDEILELYLNEIYYGNLAYGIEAASQTIFGKPASELTLGEAALLAGLPQAPAELDPLNPDPAVQEAVIARRRLVIDLMLEEGFTTEDEAYAAYGEPLSYVSPDVPLVAPHFTVFARSELEALMAALGYPPDLLTTGGLEVYTTLDLRFQELAEATARAQVASLRDAHHLTNAAVVVTHPVTGEILAMVGSVDYWDDGIDGRVNVATAARQPGSTMKPFTYSAALEQGWTAANIIWDTETHIGIPGQEEYVPVNYDSAYHGPVRVRDALANSYNVAAVQTLRQVGVPYLLNLMQRFGVQSLGDDAGRYGLSLTLGGGEVTLLELTRAYSVFANGGVLVPTTSILCVVDGEDNILYQYDNRCPRGQNSADTVNAPAYGIQVLDPRIAFVISDILADNAARTPAMGARSPLYTGDLVSSVKTGTTNDTRDNWTVGYTHNVAIGVWAGNSDNTPMVNTSGLTGAAPIWHDILMSVYNNPDLLGALAQEGQLLPDYLTAPEGVSRHHVCELSALSDPATGCPATRVEWFLDSPALIPGPEGTMVASGNPLAPPLVTPDPNGNGPQLTEPERGLFQVLAQPLPDALAQAAIPASLPNTPSPPAPRYCLVPNEVANQVPTALHLLFIAPPPDPRDAVYAAHWARAANMPILPGMACTGEMLTAVITETGGGQQPGGEVVVTAYISSPAPGQEVREIIPILGTASFTPDQAQFYKIEMRGPQFPEWVTLGDTHAEAVVDGQLETLAAAGLQPGQYFLRLIIVGHDGNYLQPPYEVSFTVPQ